MKLYLQNKLISLGDSSYVLDEAGKNFFQVNGKVVSPTRKKFLCDLQGNTLYMIRNKYWHFFTHSAFICDSNGQKIVKIKVASADLKACGLESPRLTIAVDQDRDDAVRKNLLIGGDFISRPARRFRSDCGTENLCRYEQVQSDGDSVLYLGW